ENYAGFLYDKAQTVRAFEAAPEGIVAKSRENTSQTAEILKQMTYGITYPGIMDMPEGADDLIDDIVMESPFGVSLILVTAFHDRLSICSIQRFDGDKIVNALCRKLSSCGIKAEITCNELVEQNVMNLERLKRI
ncbi:MAG: hypothetical protein II954_00080, partial [Synergistaceae bacterium]|nr:hypothetical protein [Synergistaceae bacterium]